MDFQGQVLHERYQIGPELGAGGAATVYRAEDLRLGRVVAIKLLRPELRGDPTFVARFEREARSIARLEHPHIVPIYDYGEGLGTYFLVMQYVPGGNLRARVRRDGPLSIAAAVRIGAEVAEALGAAHAHGIVHRDVKSANILLMEDDGAKVTDFGIAKMLDVPALTASAALLGTPHYLAPEQASGGAITPATDVYALGVVLYEMLAGKRPYEGDSFVWIAMQHLCAIPQPLAEINPAVPSSVAALVERVLAKEPEQRFCDGAAFAEALRALERDLGVPHDVSTSDLADQPGTSAAAPAAGARAASIDLDSGPRWRPSPAVLASVAPPGWQAPSEAAQTATKTAPTGETADTIPVAVAARTETVPTAAAPLAEPAPTTATPLAATDAERASSAPATSEAAAVVNASPPEAGSADPDGRDKTASAAPTNTPLATAAAAEPTTQRPALHSEAPSEVPVGAVADPADDRRASRSTGALPPRGYGDETRSYFPRRRTSFVPIVLVLGLGLLAAVLVARAGGDERRAPVYQVAGRAVQTTVVPTAAAPAGEATPEAAAPGAAETPGATPAPAAVPTLVSTLAPTALPTALPTAAPTDAPAAAAPAPPAAEAPAPAAPAAAVGAGGRVVIDDDAFTGGYSAPRNYRGRTARWVYGAQSEYGQMTASFTVQGTPGAGTLVLRGLDSENGPKTPVQVLVNETVVYQGGNPLPKDDWRSAVAPYGEASIEIPRGVLRAGRNTLTVKNQAPVANFNAPPYVVLDEAIVTY